LSVFSNGKDLTTVLFELGDEREVKPLVFSWMVLVSASCYCSIMPKILSTGGRLGAHNLG
jgi:hypothetical protein